MVSREDSDEMARLNRIMNGERPAPTAASRTTSAGAPNPNDIILQEGVSGEDISNMAEIMKNFSSATGVTSFKSLHDTATGIAENIVKESKNSPELRDALFTEKTDSGMRVGSWEITKHQRAGITSKNESIYRVNNIKTGQQIKAQFMVMESASTVVKLLNEGSSFSHPVIQQIAKYEIEYREMRKQALEEKQFWQRAKKNDNEFKQNLYEAKFDAAKSKALLIRERLINTCLKA